MSWAFFELLTTGFLSDQYSRLWPMVLKQQLWPNTTADSFGWQ
jgi:hypothetical protein